MNARIQEFKSKMLPNQEKLQAHYQFGHANMDMLNLEEIDGLTQLQKLKKQDEDQKSSNTIDNLSAD